MLLSSGHKQKHKQKQKQKKQYLSHEGLDLLERKFIKPFLYLPFLRFLHLKIFNMSSCHILALHVLNSMRTNFFLVLRQNISNLFTQCFMNYKLSYLANGNRYYYQPCVSILLYLSSFKWFFPWFFIVSYHAWSDQYPAEYSRAFYRFLYLWSSLSVNLSLSPVFSLIYSRWLDLLGFSSLSNQLREFAMFYLAVPPCSSAWKPSLASNLSNHRIHLICYSFHKNNYLQLLDIQCLENCHLIYVFLYYLVVSCVMVNLLPVIAPWLEVKAWIHIFY